MQSKTTSYYNTPATPQLMKNLANIHVTRPEKGAAARTFLLCIWPPDFPPGRRGIWAEDFKPHELGMEGERGSGRKRNNERGEVGQEH